ncbi:MAG: hypothetical protein ABII74_05920 [Elusimicrobiota bacterium]
MELLHYWKLTCCHSGDCCFYKFIPKGFWNIGGDEIPAKIVKNNLSPEGAKDSAVKEVIKLIKEWKVLQDKDARATGREYGESVHSMNKTDHSFRIVAQRWPNPDQDLFEKRSEYCYHGIATNFSIEEKSSEEIISRHNARSNSENYNKEIKPGFNPEYMPSGNFAAKAVRF